MIENAKAEPCIPVSDLNRAASFYGETLGLKEVQRYEEPAANPMIRYGVGDGTVLVGKLNMPLGSRTSRTGDRFSLTVSGPQGFQGAVIDGIVGRVGSEQSDRNELILDFDRIRLRDGRTR